MTDAIFTGTQLSTILSEARTRWALGSPGTAKRQAGVAAIVIGEIERDLAGLAGQDAGTWTVLGIWDNDEAVPVGAIAGRHAVHGEAPGDRIRDELFEANAEFYGFSTSSFYEQGVWAVTVTAPSGDAAQDAAVTEMMRAQHGDDWEPGCSEENEECQGGTCRHPYEPEGN